MVVRYLIMGIFFALQTAYAGSVGFDGIGTAMGVNSDVPWDFVEARKNYFSRLKRQRLSQNDEPEIFEGYLTIVNYFAEQEVPAAKIERQNLIEKPTEATYQDLLKRLKGETGLFSGYLPPILKKNFGLSAIDLLERARKQIGKIYPSSVRAGMTGTDELDEKALMINNIEDQMTNAAHRIMSGSFGGKRKATLDERKTMVQFLLNTVDGIIDQGGDIEPLLRNYDWSMRGGAFNESMLKKHISICRTMLASMYYLVKNKVKVLTGDAEAAIKKLGVGGAGMPTVREVLKGPEIQALLKSKLGSFSLEEPVCVKRPAASSVAAPVNGDDFKFKPENQRLYDRYVANPRDFDGDITSGLLKYVPKEAGLPFNDDYNHPQKLALNAINFLIATQAPGMTDNIRILAYKDGNCLNEAHSNILELNGFNKIITDYEKYVFHLDKVRLESALQRVKPIATLVYLSNLFSIADLKHCKYNINCIRINIGKFWKSLYETLVYAYVFAKDQGKEKAFFKNAFPNERHCSDSLSTATTTWLRAEKEALGQDPTKATATKLSSLTRELIQADNLFIGNAVNNFILYWLAPKYLEWAEKQGYKVALKDIEDNPSGLLMSYPDVGKQADAFSNDVAALIEQAAKERAIQGFEKIYPGHPVDYAQYDHNSGWYNFSTTDSDLRCAIKVKAGKGGYGQPKPTITDIEKVEVFQGYNKPLREYLREKFLEYFE